MLDSIDIQILRFAQDDLPLVSNPYREFARQSGISEDEIIRRLKRLSDEGYIRRFGAVIRHREAGYGANAMVVWKVEESAIDQAAGILAESDAVSHLYRRKTFPGWDYNLYSMIHAVSDEGLNETIAEFITRLDGIFTNYMILKSKREFKKTSMKYFTE